MNNPVRYIDIDGMYSTEEWMKDNGVTQDDLITIYQTPSDDKEKDRNENDEKNREEKKEKNDANENKVDSETEDKEEAGNPAGKVLKMGGVLALGVFADNITLIGIGDDVLIPPIVVSTAVLAGITYVGYEIYQFAKEGGVRDIWPGEIGNKPNPKDVNWDKSDAELAREAASKSRRATKQAINKAKK